MVSWRCSSAVTSALPQPPAAVSLQPQQEGRGVIRRVEERMPTHCLSALTMNNAHGKAQQHDGSH